MNTTHYLRDRQVDNRFDDRRIIKHNKGRTKNLAFLLQKAQDPFQQYARKHAELTRQVELLIKQIDQKSIDIFDEAVTKNIEAQRAVLSECNNSEDVKMPRVTKNNRPDLRSTLEKIKFTLGLSTPSQDCFQQDRSMKCELAAQFLGSSTNPYSDSTSTYLQNANIIYESERQLEESGIIIFSGFDYYAMFVLRMTKIRRLRERLKRLLSGKEIDRVQSKRFMTSIDKLVLKSQMKSLAHLACQLLVESPSNALTCIIKSRFAANNTPPKVYIADLIVKLAKKMHLSLDETAGKQLLHYIDTATGDNNRVYNKDDTLDARVYNKDDILNILYLFFIFLLCIFATYILFTSFLIGTDMGKQSALNEEFNVRNSFIGEFRRLLDSYENVSICEKNVTFCR